MLDCDQIIITKFVMMHLLLPFSLMMDTKLYLDPAFPIHMEISLFITEEYTFLPPPPPKNSTADTPHVY